MTGSTEDDLRDVFKLLYNDEDWASDDELDARTQPEVEQVEVELDPFQRHLERYSRKRFMADLDDLLRPSAKRQRVLNPSATSSSSSIPSTSPFPDLPSTSTYAPYSPLPLLSRLRTFHPSSYSTYIPSPLNASSAALYGWINDEKDSLWCGLCQARWSLGEVAGITEDKVRVEVAKRLKTGLVTKHKKGCAWRVRSCPETLHSKLRQTLHPPLVSSLSALAQHIDSECLPGPSTYRWTSPLTVSQATSLCARISRSPSDNDEQSSNRQSFAAALALFGWYPFHPNGPVHTLMPTSESSQSTDIVQCRICERRVGLWAFSKPSEETARVRTFDLIEEHLGWCPIRGGDKAWWADLPLLREKDKGLQTKDWIRVSTRLETKSWRKKHAVGLDT